MPQRRRLHRSSLQFLLLHRQSLRYQRLERLPQKVSIFKNSISIGFYHNDLFVPTLQAVEGCGLKYTKFIPLFITRNFSMKIHLFRSLFCLQLLPFREENLLRMKLNFRGSHSWQISMKEEKKNFSILSPIYSEFWKSFGSIVALVFDISSRCYPIIF